MLVRKHAKTFPVSQRGCLSNLRWLLPEMGVWCLHAHIHTHTHTHIHTHKHTNTQAHTHTHTHACTCRHTHACTHTNTHTYISQHTHKHTDTQTHTHTKIYLTLNISVYVMIKHGWLYDVTLFSFFYYDEALLVVLICTYLCNTSVYIMMRHCWLYWSVNVYITQVFVSWWGIVGCIDLYRFM